MDTTKKSLNGRFPMRERRFESIPIDLSNHQLAVLDDYARVVGAADRSEAIGRLIDSLSRSLW